MYKYHIEKDNFSFRVNFQYENEHGNLVTETKSFFNELSAKVYARNHEKDYIVSWLKRYVGQASILYNTGNVSFYRTSKRENAIRLVTDQAKQAQHNTLSGVCLDILRMEEELRILLPAPSNNNYRRKLENLNSILKECGRIRRIQQLQIA